MWVGPGASVLSPSGGETVRLGYRQASELPIELTCGRASGGSRRIPTRPEGGTRFRWIERLVWRPVCQGHTCGGRCGGSRTADREVGMPNQGDVHVVYSKTPRVWRVEVTGNKRASGSHQTKPPAIVQARKLAQRNKSELVVHSQDGKIG